MGVKVWDHRPFPDIPDPYNNFVKLETFSRQYFDFFPDMFQTNNVVRVRDF